MQRADGFTDLCEMKHSTNVFTIDRDYATNLQNKIEAYQELSKDKRTLHLVTVTTTNGSNGTNSTQSYEGNSAGSGGKAVAGTVTDNR